MVKEFKTSINKMTDTKKRSLAKSLTWRIIGILILGAITYFITGSWGETTIIAFTFHGIRFVLYYYHERIWENIQWGRKPPEYQI